MTVLEDVVENNNKRRFEFNEDKTKIRARQGHSIDVDLQDKPVGFLAEDYMKVDDKNMVVYITHDEFLNGNVNPVDLAKAGHTVKIVNDDGSDRLVISMPRVEPELDPEVLDKLVQFVKLVNEIATDSFKERNLAIWSDSVSSLHKESSDILEMLK